MSRLAHFFRLFCLTDESLLQQVGQQNVRRFQTFHGLSVVLVSLLAWGTGTAAVYVVFGNVFLALVLGTVFALIILCIDTLIAGSGSKKAVWARLPIAVVVGFAVAYAAELALTSDRLDRVIREDVAAENEAVLERIRTRRGLPDLEQQIELAAAEVARLTDVEAMYAERATKELIGEGGLNQTSVRGEGPAYREAKRNQLRAQAELAGAQEAAAALRSEREDRQAEVQETFEAERIEPEGDFLAYAEALAHLKDETPALVPIVWGLRLVLLMLDLTPALVLLFREMDTYHLALEARVSLDEAMMNLAHNAMVTKATKNPGSIKSYYTTLVGHRQATPMARPAPAGAAPNAAAPATAAAPPPAPNGPAAARGASPTPGAAAVPSPTGKTTVNGRPNQKASPTGHKNGTAKPPSP